MEEAVAEAVEQAVAEAEKLAEERAEKLAAERAQKLAEERINQIEQRAAMQVELEKQRAAQEKRSLIHRLLNKGFDINAIADMFDESISAVQKQAEGTAIL